MTWRPREQGWGRIKEEAGRSVAVLIRTVLEVVPGGVIRAGKRTYSDTTAGWWLGIDDDGVPRFHIGNAAHYLRWTGTTLEFKGNLAGDVGAVITIGAGGRVEAASGNAVMDDSGFTVVAGVGESNWYKLRLDTGELVGLLAADEQAEVDLVARGKSLSEPESYLFLGAQHQPISQQVSLFLSSADRVITVNAEEVHMQMACLTFEERAAPAAPAANQARLYVRDDGAGKTQLVVRFATGGVQVLASE